ncbi:uncharacterized protein LOC142335506 isoform X2 [Convolutriloba macropyga]|uniref:uncharacterized protein LOC142335506 isoform X2 n=1 Tax=Convolutriloba macropyga TaxID=536237 RepID=UPI003F527A75
MISAMVAIIIQMMTSGLPLVGGRIPFSAVECPCIASTGQYGINDQRYEGGDYDRRVFARDKEQCFAFCVVQKCYAFTYSDRTKECDIYLSADTLGYVSAALNSMNCQSNGHEDPDTGRKWYLRTSGGKDTSSMSCEQFYQKYSNAADGIYTDKVKVRGFTFPKGSSFCHRIHGHQIKLQYPAFTNWIGPNFENSSAIGHYIRIDTSKCIIRVRRDFNPFWEVLTPLPGIHGSENLGVGNGGACFNILSQIQYTGGGHLLNINGTGLTMSHTTSFFCDGPTTRTPAASQLRRG